MEGIFTYICENAHNAHWIIFCLLLLAGLNIPISEDVMLLSGGAIASSCIPDHTMRLFIWIFLGCYLSAWEAYWIGRLLGPKLYKIPILKNIVTPARTDKLRHFYAKYGIFTFIFGRFCPGGIRNALFYSSGLTKMPFNLFILRDGIACAISSTVLFFVGYKFGENIDVVLKIFHRYSQIVLILIITVISIALLFFWYKHRKSNKINNKENLL